MKKCIAAILFVSLIMGRPTHGQHESAIGKHIASVFDIEQSDGVVIAQKILGHKYLKVFDFYLFTIGEIKGQVVSIGVLRTVYVLDKTLTLKIITQ